MLLTMCGREKDKDKSSSAVVEKEKDKDKSSSIMSLTATVVEKVGERKIKTRVAQLFVTYCSIFGHLLPAVE